MSEAKANNRKFGKVDLHHLKADDAVGESFD